MAQCLLSILAQYCWSVSYPILGKYCARYEANIVWYIGPILTQHCLLAGKVPATVTVYRGHRRTLCCLPGIICQAFSVDYRQEFYYFNCYQVFSSNPENPGFCPHKNPGLRVWKSAGLPGFSGARVAFPSRNTPTLQVDRQTDRQTGQTTVR